jgi:magnesium-transporting ATPase (P-type)
VNSFDDFFQKTKNILFKIVEILTLVVAILLLIYLLLGEASGDYIISVAVNISLFISAVTPEALAAVALGLALYTYINKK